MRNRKSILTFGLLTIFFVGIISCDRSPKKLINSKQTVVVDSNNVLTDNTKVKKDTVITADTINILGKSYFANYTSNDIFFIINEHSDTLFTDNELCPQFEFEDFDKDGYEDIRFHYMSNTPSVQDLIMFDFKTKSFKKVENFSSYPEPIKLEKTKYYYSYHRSGCADMNWDSDLFYIDNFKTIRIGNISGRECHDRDVKDGIYINKVKGETETIYKTLPIETIGQYEDYKWGFIKDYWTKNFTKFIK